MIKKLLKALFTVCENTTIGRQIEGENILNEDTPSETARKFLKECISNMDFDVNKLDDADALPERIITEDANDKNKFHSWVKS